LYISIFIDLAIHLGVANYFENKA